MDKRILQSQHAAELFVTAVPRAGAAVVVQAEEVFSDVAAALRAAGARVFQERVFGTHAGLPAAVGARSRAYGDLDDGVPPALLLSPPGNHGDLAGVQVHAVVGEAVPRVLPAEAGAAARGRWVALHGRKHVALAGLAAPQAGTAPAQARAVLEMAERLLRQVGGDMSSVARTWLWLGDILSWYAEFNRVRTEFFVERRLTGGRPGKARLPASTGIGVPPAGADGGDARGDGPACAMDLRAVVWAGEDNRLFAAAGRQDSAYRYGSAFSRAARSPTPGGETLFVSGTAAIDAGGTSRHVGDAAGQIEHTLANVRAVLAEQDCRDEDVVQAIAYCKTPQVEALWRRRWGGLPWPCVTVISDICREELLFELEATACPGARRA